MEHTFAFTEMAELDVQSTGRSQFQLKSQTKQNDDFQKQKKDKAERKRNAIHLIDRRSMIY